MEQEIELSTKRLKLQLLKFSDDNFILELLNTPGWIKYIGDRNIANLEDARAYIKRITDNPDIIYWTVQRADDQTTVGLCTLMKKTHLPHHDIGFAFLPQFSKQGYAFEGSMAVLDFAFQRQSHEYIMAETLPANVQSIELLKKLGLTFHSNTLDGDTELSVFHLSAHDYLAKIQP